MRLNLLNDRWRVAYDAPAPLNYRPSIDGLRAIAVLSVVIFHIFPESIRGGFIGVDVFFVISGYLISFLVFRDMSAGIFSLAAFYGRRIRRIFPALIFVLTTVLIAGWIALFPDDYVQLGKYVASSAAFVANFALSNELAYFDPGAETKFLIHLWSLGVEEQFYLIWPILLMVLYRRRLNIGAVCVSLVVISLVYCGVKTFSNQTVAFYSPLTRFWELGAGSLLAYFQLHRGPAVERGVPIATKAIVRAVFVPTYDEADSRFLTIVSLVGLVLLVVGASVIRPGFHFPGWWALLPVTGAVAIIGAGEGAWFNRRILAARPLVWIGLISYPLYLWHWPLLVYVKYTSDRPLNGLKGSGILLCSFVLAAATYRLVERPLRFGARPNWLVPCLATAMVALFGFGVAALATNGFPSRFQDRAAYAAYFEGYLFHSDQFVEERQQIAQNQCNFYTGGTKFANNPPKTAIDPSCTKVTPGAQSVLIWGDSNAADLLYGMQQTMPRDVDVNLIFASGCRVRPFDENDIKDHCDKANSVAFNFVKAHPPNVVLFSSNNSFEIAFIRKLSAELTALGIGRVVVVGQKPHWKPWLYKIIARYYWHSTPRYIKGHEDLELLQFGKDFQAAMTDHEPFTFIDGQEPFCNADGCLTYIGDDHMTGLVTFDDSHLRPFASVYFAQKALVPRLLEMLGRGTVTIKAP